MTIEHIHDILDEADRRTENTNDNDSDAQLLTQLINACRALLDGSVEHPRRETAEYDRKPGETRREFKIRTTKLAERDRSTALQAGDVARGAA